MAHRERDREGGANLHLRSGETPGRLRKPSETTQRTIGEDERAGRGLPWERGLDEDPEQMTSLEDLGHRDAAYDGAHRERGFKYGAQERGFGNERTFYGDDRDYGYGTRQGMYAGFASPEEALDGFDTATDSRLEVRSSSAGRTHELPVRDWQRPQQDDVSSIPPEDAGSGSRRSSPSFAGRGPKNYRRPDESIREEVCERLAEAPDLDPSDVDVRVESGVVVLEGTVESRAAKRQAEDLATAVRAVVDVRNDLRVR